ncbi:hypothetical protein Tco_1086743 [Tanacetum coccineum]
MLLASFMAICHPPVPPTVQVMGTLQCDNQIFDNVDYQLSQEMHQEEHLDSDAETEIDDNTIPYHQYLIGQKPKCSRDAKQCCKSMLQRFNMPTQTIPMLSKKPKKATNDLHKDIIRHSNQSRWDSERGLGSSVSMKKMNEKPGHVRPANDFYAKLNALMFVPQKELSGDQVYWLSANEIASQASKPATPATPFVHKSRPPSQVLASLRNVNAAFPQFEGISKKGTNKNQDYVSEWCYDYAKQFIEQQLVPFYDHFKKHIQAANDTFSRGKRIWKIFDELEAELNNEKDILASMCLLSDIVVPPSSNCLCEDLRSACDREHTKVLELEAEISKQKQLFIESEKHQHMKVLNVVPLKGSCDQQAFDTDRIQFEDSITSLRIQLDGLGRKTTKPATESRKPMPKSHTRNHRILPNKSVNARRAADHNRKLNVVDHNQFVIRSLKSVNTKTPQAKHSVNYTKKVWKATGIIMSKGRTVAILLLKIDTDHAYKFKYKIAVSSCPLPTPLNSGLSKDSLFHVRERDLMAIAEERAVVPPGIRMKWAHAWSSDYAHSEVDFT